MRFLPLLPFLAATVLASDPEPSKPSPSEEPTPAGQLWTAQWTPTDLSSYSTHCATTTTLKASIYKLGEMYPKLEEWAPQLKVFYNKQLYPGSWEGVDAHGVERELLKMNYEDLPFALREWISKNTKQRHFSVQDDIVFFAPGAIYPILPLFVEESGSDQELDCEGMCHPEICFLRVRAYY